MISILLHESLDPFYQTISSFPTVIYSFFLFLCVLLWLATFLGIIEIDFFDLSPDIEAATQTGGLLMKAKLDGVPLTISISIISLFGWLSCFLIMYYSSPYLPDFLIMQTLWGMLVLLVTLAISTLITGFLIKPLKPIFKTKHENKSLIGCEAIIRSSRVDANYGEANVNDGGAGLILQVRSTEHSLNQGDEVVLFEYDSEKNTYTVLPKSVYEEMKSNI